MKAVNLIPTTEQRVAPAATTAKASEPQGSAGGAYLVLAALALAVVAVAGYVLTGNTIKEREAQLATVQAEAETVNRQAAALQPFAEFQNLAAARTETVRALATSRFDWEQVLRDLSHALPAGARLKSFKGTAGGAAAAPAAGAPAGAVAAPSVQLSGCTGSQTSVADLMASLRAVRGVTRVSLSKSAKDADTATAVVGPPGSAPVGLCGKGAKANFDLVVYFERAPIALGAQPNAGAKPAQPAAGAAKTTPAGAAPAASPPATGQPTTAGQPSAPATTPSTTQGVSAP